MRRAWWYGALAISAALGSGCGVEGVETVEDVPAEAEAEAEVAQAPSPAAPVGATDIGISCPPGGGGPRIVRLSDVMPGACNDQLALQNIIFDIGAYGKLIIDKPCELDAGIRLPNPFTLSGLNDAGAGQIVFSNDGIGISVCQELPRQNVTIEDLAIFGPYAYETKTNPVTATHSIGIALANLNIVHLNRVRVTDFYVGLKGTSSFSVDINDSNISVSRQDNIVVGYNSNGWRIRDGLSSQATRYGINVLGPGDAEVLVNVDGQGHDANTSNDLLIDGVRMESNGQAAIRSAAHSTRIVNNRFEGNGAAAGLAYRPAVHLTGAAQSARVLTNLFGGTGADCLRNQGVSTQTSLNIPVGIGCI